MTRHPRLAGPPAASAPVALAPAGAAPLRPALAGAREVLPLAGGIVPLAMVIGVTARSSGVDPSTAWAASFLLIAGAAQLSLLQMLHEDAAPIAAVVTVIAINARFVVYSLGFRRWFEREPLGWRLLLAVALVDQLFLVCERRFAHHDDDPGWRRRYYLGAAGLLVGCWSGTQGLSMVLVGVTPPAALLRAATPILFLAFLVPTIVDRSVAATVAAAASVTVAASALPCQANLLAGLVAGTTVGVALNCRSLEP